MIQEPSSVGVDNGNDIERLVDESEILDKDGFRDPTGNYPRKEYDKSHL